MTVLEDGAGGDRHLVSAPAATPAVSPNRPSLSPCAPRAHPSGGPAQGYKILGTGLVAVEALLQLQQSPGIILAHDHEHYMLGLVASSKYPYPGITNQLGIQGRNAVRLLRIAGGAGLPLQHTGCVVQFADRIDEGNKAVAGS